MSLEAIPRMLARLAGEGLADPVLSFRLAIGPARLLIDIRGRTGLLKVGGSVSVSFLDLVDCLADITLLNLRDLERKVLDELKRVNS